MAWSSSATSASDLAARARDNPVGIAVPRAATSVATEWNTDTGSFSETDRTATGYPGTRALDGVFSRNVVTKPTGATTSVYFLMNNPSLWTFDSMVIAGHNLDYVGSTSPATIISLQISDYPTFSGYTTIGFAAYTGGTRRIVWLNLDHTAGNGRLYSNVQYARLLFAGVTLADELELGEVVLGRQRQFLRNPVDPYDILGRESTIADASGRDRVGVQYAMSSGRYFRETELHTLTSSDRTVMRALHSDADHGTRPVVWIDRPTTAPHVAPLCAMGGTRDSWIGPMSSRMPITLTESAPYVSGET